MSRTPQHWTFGLAILAILTLSGSGLAMTCKWQSASCISSVADRTLGHSDPVFLPRYAQQTEISQGATQPSGTNPGGTADEIETTFWNTVKDSNDPALLEAYLDRFPQGAHAAEARQVIDRLRAGGQTSPTPSPPPETRTLVVRIKLGQFPTKDGADRGWLGVKIQDVGDSWARSLGLPHSKGALITEVTANSPAEAHLLKALDIVVRVDGRTVEGSRDLARIIASYSPAAEIEAQLLRIGEGVEDIVRSLRGAAEAGNVDAMFQLGFLLGTGSVIAKDDAEAVRWYKMAAEKGNAQAMTNLGRRYYYGEGVPKDHALSVKWYRQAAEGGSVDAFFALGVFYDEGTAVAKDIAESERWYRKAANGGNVLAMYNLGNLLNEGRGVDMDRTEAVRLYRQAAETGHTKSMAALARSYATGQGVEKNPSEAARWMYGALEKGDEFAVKEMTENAATWSGEFIRHLQERLKSAGLYDGPVDGKFGPGLRRAVQSLARQPQSLR
jgi:hypothetical protein